ncbi:MAG TPA: hypothetical protein PL185_03020 [Flavobacteriales bacterium]|nr:hypothetical protein [Flavobacteriales bacterium]HPH81512.1 hypothetical protein [Flavobacteriales bacterium]
MMSSRRFIHYVFSLFCFGFSLLADAQIDTIKYEHYRSAKNCIYGEIAGSGYLLSVHYERTLWMNESLSFNARIGVGSALFINAIPLVGLNATYGKKASKLEVGFNAIRTYTFGIMGGESTYLMGNPILGYRYQKANGFLFRATVCPFFPLYDPDNWLQSRLFVPYGGLSFGYAF